MSVASRPRRDGLREAADVVPTPSGAVRSPCISVCRMDEVSGWCEGCLRMLDEIAAWAELDDAARRAVWVELGRRRVVWRRQHRPPAPDAT